MSLIPKWVSDFEQINSVNDSEKLTEKSLNIESKQLETNLWF